MQPPIFYRGPPVTYQPQQNLTQPQQSSYTNNQNYAQQNIPNYNLFNRGPVFHKKQQPQKITVDSPVDVKEIPTEIIKKTKYLYVPKKDKSSETYVFEMKQTMTDVYLLYVVEPVVKNSTTYLKRKKVCLAYIPNVTRSKWCRDINDEYEGQHVLVNCTFHHDRKKWEPISVSTLKTPSYTTEFDTIVLN